MRNRNMPHVLTSLPLFSANMKNSFCFQMNEVIFGLHSRGINWEWIFQQAERWNVIGCCSMDDWSLTSWMIIGHKNSTCPALGVVVRLTIYILMKRAAWTPARLFHVVRASPWQWPTRSKSNFQTDIGIRSIKK